MKLQMVYESPISKEHTSMISMRNNIENEFNKLKEDIYQYLEFIIKTNRYDYFTLATYDFNNEITNDCKDLIDICKDKTSNQNVIEMSWDDIAN